MAQATHAYTTFHNLCSPATVRRPRLLNSFFSALHSASAPLSKASAWPIASARAALELVASAAALPGRAL
jgi:hypothetical protein